MKKKIKNYELIKRAVAQEQAAFREITSLYRDGVAFVVRKVVFDAREVEDLVQETFIKAFLSIHSFRFEFEFSTWLFRIATNHSIDFLRKKRLKMFSMNGKASYRDGEEKKWEFPDRTDSIEKKIISEETTLRVRNEINRLPEKYRIVIIMRHETGMSYEEISEKLNLPLGTIKVRIFRGRELLNRALRDILG